MNEGANPAKKNTGKSFPFVSKAIIGWNTSKLPIYLAPLTVIEAGYATKDGVNGADYWLYYKHKLPEYYITKKQARALGWRTNKGNLAEAAPGKMIGGDPYYNENGHLPDAPGQIWYEADISYIVGFRGKDRILYSNDGLIFVTCDHYETFYEISERRN